MSYRKRNRIWLPTLLCVSPMLTLLGELWVHSPQRIQERKRRNCLGRLVHPHKQIPQVGRDTSMTGATTERADHGVGLAGAVCRKHSLELGNGPECLQRGVHVASVAKVGQAGWLLELRWTPRQSMLCRLRTHIEGERLHSQH